MRPTRSGPLSNSQIETLDDFLMSQDNAMNIEMTDGFMTALICSPVFLTPSEFLPYIWGEPEFDSTKQAEEIISLIMQHWNDIQSVLSSGEMLAPFLYEEEPEKDQENTVGKNWAEGFLLGIGVTQEAWDEVMQDSYLASWTLPAPILAGKELPPELNLSELKQLDRLDLLGALVTGVGKFYEHFKPQRSMQPASTTHFAKAPKIGRNQRCPCGSGKKYKRCCGS